MEKGWFSATEGEEHGAEQASSTGLPCIYTITRKGMTTPVHIKKQSKRSHLLQPQQTKTNLIGREPRTTPLQLRAAIALSACVYWKLLNKSHITTKQCTRSHQKEERSSSTKILLYQYKNILKCSMETRTLNVTRPNIFSFTSIKLKKTYQNTTASL